MHSGETDSSRYEREMTNPGFIPPVDWDLKSDGEQNSLDLRNYALQLESEIERLEAWETKAVSQYYFGAEEIDSWHSHLCQCQIDRIFDIWIHGCGEALPFVRKKFAKFIGSMTLPDEVILLHRSVMKSCAKKTRAAANYCARRWADTQYRSVLRCILEPHGFVNIIREGALARTRFWIKRILNGKFTASNRGDLDGVIRISKAVLSRVRAAYTWEAPTSFLGADDLEIVQWTYPLVCGIPAECSVSENQLRKELKAGKCEFGKLDYSWDSFEDYADARRFLEYSKWFCSEYQSRANPSAYDVDGECLQAGLKMIAIALREAERFGLPSVDIPNIQNEVDSAEFVEMVVRLTIAEMPQKETVQAIKGWKPHLHGTELRERTPEKSRDRGKGHAGPRKRGRKPATIEEISEACRVHIAYQEKGLSQKAFCEQWNRDQGKNAGCVHVGLPWLRRQLALVRKLMREEPYRIPIEFANKLSPLRRVKKVPQKRSKNSRRSS